MSYWPLQNLELLFLFFCRRLSYKSMGMIHAPAALKIFQVQPTNTEASPFHFCSWESKKAKRNDIEYKERYSPEQNCQPVLSARTHGSDHKTKYMLTTK